jgi:cytochrome P450
MSDGAIDLTDARAQAHAMALADINVADPDLFRSDTVWPYFDRLRHEDPVHLHPAHHHRCGAFWSVTCFNDIVAVDTNHEAFSSSPMIVLDDPVEGFDTPMFIAMDPPKHDVQRKTVSPMVSPKHLDHWEPLIRSRIVKTLDELPIGAPFDWVELVSKELTSQMLATLFDFPFEDRRKLTFWSDLATAEPDSPLYKTDNWELEYQEHFGECAAYFTTLWNERVNAEPKSDLISMLAHGEATRNMDPLEFLGNLILLIVGGNDTTRNTMSGSVHELHRNPAERTKLNNDPGLVPSMVSETIRWQTPLAYMRRTTTRDVELAGKTIPKGDKVVMWYASGNRDETVIERPYDYVIDRPNVRHHLSFGFGIHRCVGNRLAELQLKILWEEILGRFPEIQVLGATRVRSAFVRGFETMQTVIPRRY